MMMNVGLLLLFILVFSYVLIPPISSKELTWMKFVNAIV